jgi:cell division protein ZapA
MGEVTVTVNSRPYRMACEDGQEGHLKKLGQGLASRVEELAKQVGQVGDAQLLVMAALITADELAQIEQADNGNVADTSLEVERNKLVSDLAAKQSEKQALQEALDRREAEVAEAARLISALKERVDRLTQSLT